MRLYLSSYGLGNQPEKLQQMVGDNKTAGVIVNAVDWADKPKRDDRLGRAMDEMSSLGYQPEELDLRKYFGNPEGLAKRLGSYGLLWIRGGNVFILQRAMKLSGFDQVVRPLVASESLVYAGFSAGSCAATPNLHGIELTDDKDLYAEGYAPGLVWEGLDFVPYSIAPHYKSDHPESADIDKTVEYFKAHNMPYKTLHDGEAIVINGALEEIVGWPNP
jgi:dipeptidase E